MNIAIAKGRTEKNFIQELKNNNIIVNDNFDQRDLKVNLNNDITLIRIKSNDVINLVKFEYVDAGIVGSDVIEEMNDPYIKDIYDFCDNKCYFAFCGLPGTDLLSVESVATKYPNIAKKYMKSLDFGNSIIKLEGSLEVAPRIGLSDAIFDIVESGETIRANGLVELKRLEMISTRFICKDETPEIKQMIRKLTR